jgi:hypothetical protein
MKFRSVIEIFKSIYFSRGKMRLGRWNIHSDKETMLKIQYATEDNCGISCINYKNMIQIQKRIN